MPLVYFFSSNTKIPNSQKSNHLKKSLSETLSRFHPLAGRLVDNLYVDCNDRGVPFVEAQANCDLSAVITNPDAERIKKLLLRKLDEESPDLCMCIQATHFRCGGLAVGVRMSHNIADGLSLLTFANTWSAVARNGGGGGGGSVPTPKFDAATTYFPSRERIKAIQEMYSPLRRRTRVASLMAYIWTRLVTGADYPTKIYSVQSLVNIRSLVDPPMSENHFGNIISFTMATSTVGDSVAEIADKVWEASKPVDDVGWVTEAKAMDMMKELYSHAHMQATAL